MADLEHVEFIDGTTARVSPEWRKRWPEDFPTPVADEAAPAVEKTPAGAKKKEN